MVPPEQDDLSCMTSDLVIFATKVFFGFFAIMNPIANTPIYLGLTQGMEKPIKKKIAIKGVLTAFLIVAIFCVAGRLIFHLFGLTFPAFRIAGGILVFFVGFELIRGHTSKVESHEGEASEKLGLAISPLAIPIMAGPGTIATAMNFVSDGSITQIVVTTVIFAFMCVITLALFLLGERVTQLLGENVIKVVGRLMGLILAVIGVEMIIAGIQGAFHIIQKGT